MPAASARGGAASTEAEAAGARVTVKVREVGEQQAGKDAERVRSDLIRILKEGKKHLRDGHPGAAFVEFHLALSTARQLGDSVEEKKATRGLGASCQRQRKFREAINYHQMVLDKSMETGEHSGDTEAYGAIADCYTELGDMEKAAFFYDRYISRLEQDSDTE
eukprot:TRINITY_DN12219_c0_g1_i1.p1 TRINITY_DN12219_c0_g1~~TRINITY_DN12219_c0_g1_i1.p1  ORF type:complete len:174 (+),score=8.79 TRINITY_DN12219_c0_g1_i1:36-524(+)